ncbi:Glycerophosphodiester phosphodiesterase [Beutenbergia cavernae DSM 12333]|uniref:Glycerophosphodiester phosphodiesterase n=1 Tax=Beutenbergia cavernae (strain ATCC BAA-8 / DSM 12333 / CCUG 43141 / JCM 11478 / NBRC 16432 / NCIMB 13614 / HKI 0122) TaxID=471853 RepID=C5BZI2_BEUC1|nr:glycerophosphodiester phosphodiesterase family protein [Beutenbergia cavernae]ACQ79154.1 Glycerophosphodiester phosphodiesterase [Beutenbergia cavernae DSM 12333]
MSAPLVIAHRGNSSVAPENTLVAYAAAARAEVAMIEVDVRMTADGEGVLVHDTTVDRTSNAQGLVADLDTEEIGRIDAGAWFDASFAGTRMPMWAETVDFFVSHPEVGMLLEIKAPWDREPLERLLTQVAEAGIADRVLAQTFYPDILRMLGEIVPNEPRGFLVQRIDDEVLALAAELGVTALNPQFPLVLERPELPGKIRAAGMQCMVWTPNEPHEWAQLLEIGVDGIITDRPDRLAGWLSAQG